MKLRLISSILVCLMMSNCVHVSSKSLTALGTDMKNVNYASSPPATTSTGKDGSKSQSGGYVAFSASDINNSNAVKKIADTVVTTFSVWGAVKGVENWIKGKSIDANAATNQAKIASQKAQGLAKVAATKEVELAKLAGETVVK